MTALPTRQAGVENHDKVYLVVEKSLFLALGRAWLAGVPA